LIKPRCEAFLSEKKSAFEGIISDLSLTHAGSIHERGIVTLTANKPYNESCSHLLKNITDLTATKSFFHSKMLLINGVLKTLRIRGSHQQLIQFGHIMIVK
jgi:hypothetical protein